MFPYQEEKFQYSDALNLKYPETSAIAATHNAKKTVINMTFDTVEDAEGFTSAIFKGDKEKVYMVEPNFLNPREAGELFRDYSANCVLM